MSISKEQALDSYRKLADLIKQDQVNYEAYVASHKQSVADQKVLVEELRETAIFETHGGVFIFPSFVRGGNPGIRKCTDKQIEAAQGGSRLIIKLLKSDWVPPSATAKS